VLGSSDSTGINKTTPFVFPGALGRTVWLRTKELTYVLKFSAGVERIDLELKDVVGVEVEAEDIALEVDADDVALVLEADDIDDASAKPEEVDLII